MNNVNVKTHFFEKSNIDQPPTKTEKGKKLKYRYTIAEMKRKHKYRCYYLD